MKGDWIFKVVPWFIGFVFVAMILWWGLVGFALTKAIEHPDETVTGAGRLVHEFMGAAQGNNQK